MNKLIQFWYSRSKKTACICLILSPLSWIYRGIVFLRYFLIKPNKNLFKNNKKILTLVIGNMTLGGTGKTPMVIYLINLLSQRGFTPGVVSRGYKNKDEIKLIFQKTGVPIVCNANRYEAQKKLLELYPEVNFILSDDGLSHISMPRDLEIVMVDGFRKFGNGYCLPIGPLREPLSRLNKADFIVYTQLNNLINLTNLNKSKILNQGSNIFNMDIIPKYLRNLKDSRSLCPSDWLSELSFPGRVHAVCGIGNPERFFSLLEQNNLNLIKHIYPDHYDFSTEDLAFEDHYPIIITEKDAVKCRELNLKNNNIWVLEIKAQCSKEFEEKLIQKIKNLDNYP